MKKIVVVISGLAIAMSAIGGELFKGGANELHTYKLADPLEADAMIGGYPVWKGEGKWRVVELKRSTTIGTSTAMGEVTAFQTEGGKFVAFLAIYANLEQSSAGDWTDEPCKRDDYLYKASIGGVFRNVNCVSINHITRYPGNPSGKGAELFALTKAEGVDTPPTVLRMTWTRYSSSSRRLQYSLTINPELAGFARDSEAEWGRNSWHKSQVANDPVKKKYVEDLSVWALSFARQMEPAFQKETTAFSAIPSWRAMYDASAKAEAVKPRAALD